MSSQYRHRRFSAPDKVFTALEPGEIGVNTANRQLSVGDADGGSLGAPIPLLGMRIYDVRAAYAALDYVIYQGIIYRAKVTVSPGAFNPVQWDAVAGGQVGSFVVKTGDIMTGHLGLPVGPGPANAVRKDYVDGMLSAYATQTYVSSALSSYATTAYVNTQDAKAVLKTGSVMTGALTLPGDPVGSLDAASKAYVDSKVTTAPGVPTGAVVDFAMPVAPVGWLVCDGQQISRTTYAALYAAIGDTWGAGDGSTTFTLPSFRTRYRRHRDNDPGYANTVGTYQDPVLQSHYHGVNINSGYVSSDHQHYVSGTTGAADRSLDHLHSNTKAATGDVSISIYPGGPALTAAVRGSAATGAMDRSIDHLHSFGAWTGGINANHYHNVTGNTGGGSADGAETRPYSATVLTCIKV